MASTSWEIHATLIHFCRFVNDHLLGLQFLRFLQYFYTIKDLRDAVQPMSKLDLKSIDDEKFSDDDLKRHRVGGRLVTRREIVRSRKCMTCQHSAC